METRLNHVAIGDILKWEATSLTRVEITAEAGTKAGSAVKSNQFSGNEVWLIALTDEVGGKVIVQPHNCVVDLSHTSGDALKTALGASDVTEALRSLKITGDERGIVYIGTLAN